jgi:hypothetical protein
MFYLLFFKFKNNSKEFFIINFILSPYTLKSFKGKYNKVLLSIKDVLL